MVPAACGWAMHCHPHHVVVRSPSSQLQRKSSKSKLSKRDSSTEPNLQKPKLARCVVKSLTRATIDSLLWMDLVVEQTKESGCGSCDVKLLGAVRDDPCSQHHSKRTKVQGYVRTVPHALAVLSC